MKHEALVIRGNRFTRIELNDSQVRGAMVAGQVAQETGRQMKVNIQNKPADDIWINQENMLNTNR